MSKGCDENALLRYVLNLVTDEEAAEIKRHLAGCPSCVAYLSTFETPRDDQPQPETSANGAVNELLARPPDRWERLFTADRGRYSNPAAVQALIQASESELDSDLPRADLLTVILVESADALTPSFASRTLQALAWTRRATALLRLGRLSEARLAVQEAEKRASHIPAADYERALIAFTAADILSELGQTYDALRQIRDAAAVFLRYNDRRRHASAREMEATVLFRSGDYEAASDVFCFLLGANPTDPVIRGRLAANAAHSFVKLGRHEKALALFSVAEKIFNERGPEGYVARIAWGKTRALRALGDDEGALSGLREVWTRFDRLHANAEWVRVGVELVEWLLASGSFAEVRVIASLIYERAVAASMQLQALEAVHFLREAAIAEKLTAGGAQYVRSFLEALPSSPTAEFRQPF